MKKYPFLALTVLLALLCVLLGGGCAKNALLGAWVAEDGVAPSGYPDTMEFFKDGVCTVDGISAQYTAEDGRLLLTAFLASSTYNYKISGQALTLSDSYASVKYVKADGKGNTDGEILRADAEKSSDAPSAPAEDTPEPTLSPKELQHQQFEAAAADVVKEVNALSLSGDARGALAYCNENIDALKVTFPDEDLSALKQLQADCIEAYRPQALQSAQAACQSDGYEAALTVLTDALNLIGLDDSQINDAIAYYKDMGPVLLADLEYFTTESSRSGSEKFCKVDTVTDNTGAAHENAFRLRRTGGTQSETYLLSGKKSRFSGTVFIAYEDRSNSGTTAVVSIYADGVLLFESPVMTAGVLPVGFDLDISGCNQLKIECATEWNSAYQWLAVYIGEGWLNP